MIIIDSLIRYTLIVSEPSMVFNISFREDVIYDYCFLSTKWEKAEILFMSGKICRQVGESWEDNKSNCFLYFSYIGLSFLINKE